MNEVKHANGVEVIEPVDLPETKEANTEPQRQEEPKTPQE